MEKEFFAYIVTNKNHTVLYTGVTSNLIQRVHQHRTHSIEGFTRRYNVDKLVFFEGPSRRLRRLPERSRSRVDREAISLP